MYCPKCGMLNNENVKFCRSCGTNLSLVPQAITGRLPKNKNQQHECEGERGLAGGLTKAFMGLGYIMVTFFLLIFIRQWWGVWFLIPGFAMLGKGVAEIVTDMRKQQARAATSPLTPVRPAPVNAPAFDDRPHEIPPPPPSVTENTTRQLDPTTHGHRDTR